MVNMKYLKLFEASDNFSVKDIDWEEDMKTLEPKILYYLNGILKRIGSSISFGRTREYGWSRVHKNRLVLHEDVFTKYIEVVEEAERQYDLINDKVQDMLDHLNNPNIVLYCSNDNFRFMYENISKIQFCLKMQISSFGEMYSICEQFIPRVESIGCKRDEIEMQIEGKRRQAEKHLPNGLDYSIWLKFTLHE